MINALAASPPPTVAEVDSLLSELGRLVDLRERHITTLVSDTTKRFPKKKTILQEFFDLDRDVLVNNAVFLRNVGQGVYQKMIRFMAQPFKARIVMQKYAGAEIPRLQGIDVRTILPELNALREEVDSDIPALIDGAYQDMVYGGEKLVVPALKYIHLSSNLSELDFDQLMFRNHGLRRSRREKVWMSGFHVPLVSSMSWPHINPYEYKERGPYGLDSWQARLLTNRYPHLLPEMEALRWEEPGSYVMHTPVLAKSGDGFLLASSFATGFSITGIDFCDPEFIAAVQYGILLAPELTVVHLPALTGSIYRTIAALPEDARYTLLEQ